MEDESKMKQDHATITNAVEEITEKLENLDAQSDLKEQEDATITAEQSRQEETTSVATTAAAAAEAATIGLPNIISQCNKDEYLVKTIDWKDRKVQIITQNENGPCPLVAICNVLFLRGDLEIRPPDREVVTFEYLIERLGDYLLNHAPVDEAVAPIAQDEQSTTTTTKSPRKLEKRQATSEFVLTYRHHLDTALSILPNLKSGLDVNVKFDNIHGFEPTAELAMFDLFDVDLVHGWVADPQDIETYDVVVKKCGGTYNHTVECIVQADELNSARSPTAAIAPASSSNNYNNETLAATITVAEEEKLHQAFIANEFLKDTATQLTYYGLDLLLDSIPVDTLCVLFRNNHFSTVYRHAKSGLYMLVTDSGLVLERSIVWESLGDVDQGSSEFYDGSFLKPKIHQSRSATVTRPINEDEQEDLNYAIAVSIQDEQKRQQRNSYLQSSNGSSNPSSSVVRNTNASATHNNKKSATRQKSENSNKCIIS